MTGLKSSGLRINRGNLGVVEEFKKIQFYKCCLKNPHSKVRNFSVGGLKLDERLVAFIVSWILTPRGSNHSTPSEEDLLLIYYIMNKVKINSGSLSKMRFTKIGGRWVSKDSWAKWNE